MKVTTFENIIKILESAFSNFTFNIKDEFKVEVWYGELAYMDDIKAVLAAKKVISTYDFVTIKNIKEAYGTIDNPAKIDIEEGWGLVEKAIRIFGYARSSEALESLPTQVQKAVMYMGGFQSICEAEKKEVARGQFNKAMASVNTRARNNATLGQPLLEQLNIYQSLAENTEKTCLENHHQDYIPRTNSDIDQNKTYISHIRDIISQSSNKTEVAL